MTKPLSFSFISFLGFVVLFFAFQNLDLTRFSFEAQTSPLQEFCEDVDTYLERSEIHFDNCMDKNSLLKENYLINPTIQ